jgi:putative glutamine amidotransferase
MSKPLIGVTPNYFDGDRPGAPNPEGSYYLNEPYVQAVSLAGGIPLSLPYLEPGKDVDALLDRLDGLVLTGGFDLDMRLFGQELHPSVRRVHPRRLAFELDLCHKVVERDLPLLAICLGLQTLNLAFEGSISQQLSEHYGESVLHKQAESERHTSAHKVLLEEGSLIHRIVGTRELAVNSLHHQAVREPGEGIEITGRAPDGVPEVIERPESRFCLGVQWHPEDLLDEAPQAELFRAFVAATQGRFS